MMLEESKTRVGLLIDRDILRTHLVHLEPADKRSRLLVALALKNKTPNLGYEK